MHFGVILPNYGLDSTPEAIRRTTELAVELGFDSVWDDGAHHRRA